MYNMGYPFKLKPLPYAADALEPYIDTKTMEIHHGKHVQAYVDNLNKALENQPDYQGWSLEKLLYNLDSLPESIRVAVRNNAGGVFNHNLYFSILAPGGTALPEGELADAIKAKFGTVDQLFADLKAAGLTVFGSGWAWLVSNPTGELSIYKTPNQDTPIPEGNITPIINLDVWEHAYYLKVQNRRAEYIDNYTNIVNWEEAAKNYAKHKETDYTKV